MKPSDRWQKVKAILHSALEVSPSERSSFLDEKCGGDVELRREVESLIAAHGSADGLFESPAMEVLASTVTTGDPDALIGKTLGHYQVIKTLGAGGMGEVYLAHDDRLDRKVALKILPSFFTQDPARLKRFQQEARAASALNHPNILTIHEVGHVESVHYIATEFVEGQSLRERMQGSLKVTDSLDIAMQVVSALAAAHEAGIIHRDIKPENIMLRRDGIVKVVDFGLAKLSPQRRSGSEDSTMVDTDEGIVMGTAQYMSPEQARGIKVDARTDIWSLACVLYEMIAGRSPFAESTPGDTIVCILEREPPPLARFVQVPRELQRMITKALAKDRENRYQSAKDLLIDLRYLREELEFEAKLEKSAQPSVSENLSTRPLPAVDDTTEPTARTTEIVASQPTSSAQYIVSQLQLHKKPIGIAALALIAFLVIVSFGGARLYRSYWQSDPSRQSTTSLQTMKITRLTTTGKASRAVISPDGRYVVHVSSKDGREELRVRQVNTGSDMQIVAPAEVRYAGLTFSRDGDFIFYVVSDESTPQTTLYQVPVLGGTPRKLLSDVASAITFSPDGKRLAFIRLFPNQGEHGLMVANADGSGERRIAVRKFPNFFESVSWSPDGTSIACGAGSHVPAHNSYIVEVPSEGGAEKPIQGPGWIFMGQVEWVQDGSGLIFAASDQASASSDSLQIWFLSRDGNEVRRITNDLNNYSGVSLTSDSSRLVAVQSETVSNIWLIPAGRAKDARPITQGINKRDGKDGTALAPDGKVVYTSKESGNDDIWIMNLDGAEKTQLTSGAGINSNPSVSPDGRFIVFTSTRDGAPHIWRMDIDGANAKQLTSGSGENYAQFSTDGRWVVYTLFAGKPSLWRVSVEGGAPTPISDKMFSEPAVSPDGTMVAGIYRDDEPNSPVKIAVVPFAGGELVRVFDVREPAWGNVRWAPDGKALTYVVTTGGVSNLWSQPMAAGTPKQLTDFKTDQIFSFGWSADGKQIISSRGVETNDVVLLSNFR